SPCPETRPTVPAHVRLRRRSTKTSCSYHPRSERGRNRIVIAERQGLVADDLSGLVTLAGDQQRVAFLQFVDRGANGTGAIANFARAFRRGEDRAADSGRIFVARIVVGDDDTIRILARDRAHQRALACVAVTAGA